MSKSKEDFENMVKLYLEAIRKNHLPRRDHPEENGAKTPDQQQQHEMEIRFYAKSNNKYDKKDNELTKIEYDNIIKNIVLDGFKPYYSRSDTSHLNTDGKYYLRIYYSDDNSKERLEIEGIELIQQYCQQESFKFLYNNPEKAEDWKKIKITTKKDVLPAVNFQDFGFRSSYQIEHTETISPDQMKVFQEEWMGYKKAFRYMNRVRFSHDSIPIFIDVSIVKESEKHGDGKYKKTETIEESKVLTKSLEKYEIELEMNEDLLHDIDADQLIAHIRRVIRIILGSIQHSHYPISFSERDNVINDYKRLLYKEQGREMMSPKIWFGPQSITLQTSDVLTIQNVDMVVTDKADGERQLLFISPNRKIYMIDSNSNVIFTGKTVSNEKHVNTLLDGEYILYDRNGHIINLYAAFDIYYIHEDDKTSLPFYQRTESEEIAPNTRYYKLEKFIQELSETLSDVHRRVAAPDKDTSPSHTSADFISCSFQMATKKFKWNENVFHSCRHVLQEYAILPYHTDGLIFTPAKLSVGASQIGQKSSRNKTWELSFKWKPSEKNTIDFYVLIEKEKQEDKIYYSSNGVSYKKIGLYCGYNGNRKIDYFERMLTENFVDNHNTSYVYRLFEPHYDSNVGYCYCELKNGSLFTEEGEYFRDKMVVEFRFDPSREGYWRWIPMRVRHDKTIKALHQIAYGNDFEVAKRNWVSIHHPITEDMIRKGWEPLETAEEEIIYYVDRENRTNDMIKMRNFHNLFVKSALLKLSKKGESLIDFACGRGGDLNKWIDNKLSFVLGFDIVLKNITNEKDGICKRYFDAKNREMGKYKHETKRDIPYCIFLNADSANNIHDGTAFTISSHKTISNILFGLANSEDIEQNTALTNVKKHRNMAKNGFDMSSIQFALHYFFKNKATLHGIIRNIAECTKLNGLFVATFFDGETIFQELADRNEILIEKPDKTVLTKITKKYPHNTFPSDETSLGYEISVYQSSIGTENVEYLVNYSYLVRVLENYGFVPLTEEELITVYGFPHRKSSATFRELYSSFDIQTLSKLNSNMSELEKSISFMNRYCIFKKLRNVATKTIYKHALQEDVAIPPSIKTNELVIKQEILNETSQRIDSFQKIQNVPKVAITLPPSEPEAEIVSRPMEMDPAKIEPEAEENEKPKVEPEEEKVKKPKPKAKKEPKAKIEPKEEQEEKPEEAPEEEEKEKPKGEVKKKKPKAKVEKEEVDGEKSKKEPKTKKLVIKESAVDILPNENNLPIPPITVKMNKPRKTKPPKKTDDDA